MPHSGTDYDYSEEFGSSYHGARRLAPALEDWICRTRAEKIEQHISPTDRVLEYGVGFGWNLARLNCREKTGFDLTPELRHSVEAKGIQFLNQESKIERGAYDKVLCHHVLEHVRNPLETLRRLITYLRPTGQLLVFVPFEREQKYRRFASSDKAHHLYSWTPASFQTLFQSAGIPNPAIHRLLFRFDRAAALAAHKLKGGFGLYRLIRRAGQLLLPEYELFAASTPKLLCE